MIPAPLLTLLITFPVVLTTVAALWLLRRRAAPAAIETSETGALIVPVRELLFRGGFPFFAKSRNSLRPKLSIERDGLRFRVLKESFWPFSELDRIDAHKSFFGATMVFANGAQRSTLTVSLGDLALARQVLTALPPTLPRTDRAMALWDLPAAG